MNLGEELNPVKLELLENEGVILYGERREIEEVVNRVFVEIDSAIVEQDFSALLVIFV